MNSDDKFQDAIFQYLQHRPNTERNQLFYYIIIMLLLEKGKSRSFKTLSANIERFLFENLSQTTEVSNKFLDSPENTKNLIDEILQKNYELSDKLNYYEALLKTYKNQLDQLGFQVSELITYESQIFLDTSNEKLIATFFYSYKNFITELGFIISSEEKPIYGSWLKRLRIRVAKFWNSDETQKRLKKGEYALELALIKTKQAEADKNHAESAAALIAASANIPEIVCNIGALYMIKTTDGAGKPRLFIKTLSTDQLLLVEQKPELLNNPTGLLEALRIPITE